MTKGSVGAGIVTIITESLYDKPIVVFREYVQNSADALINANHQEKSVNLSVQIWLTGYNLMFLDNGTGIAPDSFQNIMTDIAKSSKKKTESIGYKGIGRLSGIPYCKQLTFINIIDYSNLKFQEYSIDCDKLRALQKSDTYLDLNFGALMEEIGILNEAPEVDQILATIGTFEKIFTDRNTGFLVILKDITSVLKTVIDDEKFQKNLGWLLPVPFLPELVDQFSESGRHHELFTELMHSNIIDERTTLAPAKSFDIYYNSDQLYRPLEDSLLRSYLCKSNFDQYAVCIHTFSNRRIEIEQANPFSGIRVYIDNMLLCDENELIPALQQYGLIHQGSTYEVIQAVRGIGAMIFITDKVSISANARRTFIDVTDEDSLQFLSLVGDFVDTIFKARYALSKYASATRKGDSDNEKLEVLRGKALHSLELLARSDITPEIVEDDEIAFGSLSITEQKQIVKRTINKEVSAYIKRYFSQTTKYNLETCFEDFRTWLSAN